jgi:hypothetical protein
VAARLEPIGFDANNVDDRRLVPDLMAPTAPWAAAALADPALARAYAAHVVRMSAPGYLEQLKAALADDWRKAMDVLRVEWPGRDSAVWNDLAGKQAAIRRVLAHERIARGHAVPADGASNRHELRVRLQNITALPVELLGLQAGDGPAVPPAPAGRGAPMLLPPAMGDQPAAYAEVPFALPADPHGARPPLFAVCRIAGTQGRCRVPVQVYGFALPPAGPRPPTPSIEQALARHPFLMRTDQANALAVRPGVHTVRGDLVLPQGVSLRARAGTTLRFAAGAVLSATRGALDFTGTADSPVRLEPTADRWAGVIVLDAPASLWEHVEVRRTAAIERPGWRTTGGVSFCDSPVTFRNCRFLESLGEDAVNCIRGRVACAASVFADCRSDAFDGDFVEAVFSEDCLFRNVAGDALDVSGSDLRVDRVVCRQIGDKALSAGEDSRVVATNLRIDRARMGVVAKDRSEVTLTASRIAHAEIAVAAYIKKPEYGPAAIRTDRLAIETCRTDALVQTGSRIHLNGRHVRPREIDVQSLYAAEAAR